MQRRVLVRARGLAAFRDALCERALAGGPLAVRRRVVLVPTRAAAELLRQTLEQRLAASGSAAAILPDFVTRDEWLRRLQAALPGGQMWLTRADREVLVARAARTVLERRRLVRAPFQVRPGLAAALLDFYDELLRRRRTVRRFARVVFDELRGERGIDRGSDSLIDQTCFLGFVFLAYERLVAASRSVDEHALRRTLLSLQPALPFEAMVIAVADHPADPRGLWPADFDLIGRLAPLGSIDVVMTEEAHDAGFRERLEHELPGIEEARAPGVSPSAALLVPEAAAAPVYVSRDREEELRDVARHLRARAAETGALHAPAAVVFHRPLPYLYLAQQVLTDARVPYQAFDALPLAAEPYAAVLDLVLTVARTGGTREAVLALLRSSLVRFVVDDRRVTGRDVSALAAVLRERRATAGAATYVADVEAWFGDRPVRSGIHADSARRAARAAGDVVAALTPYMAAERASIQVRALAACLRAHERRLPAEADWALRHRRARLAVLAVLETLAAAYERHDDHRRDHEELGAAIHHALEAHTFTPRHGQAGVHLVDAVAARFGAFDHVYLVGLVETDWTPRERRNIFYSRSLLRALGWPQETDVALAQQAAFRDALTLARLDTRLSAFQLDGDAVVALSPLVELAHDRPTLTMKSPVPTDLFADEMLTRGVVPAGLEPEPAGWLALRLRRPPLTDAAYAGQIAPRAAESYRVSRVDRYVTCPFKYFSEHVLGLAEDRHDGSGLTPLERGTLLHRMFEEFYRQWQRRGHGAITSALMPDAAALFTEIADAALSELPGPDAALERMRLLGSLASRGVAERVFEIEAASGSVVVERLLEMELAGAFRFPVRHGLAERDIQIRGKADRVDVLGDGSVRVVDYKLGRMPDLDTSVQVAVYAHCVQQQLEARDGRPHPVNAAMYLAFGDDRRLEGRLGGTSQPAGPAVMTRAGDFATVVEQIEAGAFPARPRSSSECQWCGYAGVCRKEYRVDDDETAESV
jgi:RecB family exonuclease